MKYIKIYEDFKNTELTDPFMDLIDDGFTVGAIFNKNYNFNYRYRIDIKPVNKLDFFANNGFSIDDIKETFLFAIPYLESIGVKVRDFFIRMKEYNGTKSLYRTYKDLDDLFERIDSEDVIYELSIFLK